MLARAPRLGVVGCEQAVRLDRRSLQPKMPNATPSHHQGLARFVSCPPNPRFWPQHHGLLSSWAARGRRDPLPRPNHTGLVLILRLPARHVDTPCPVARLVAAHAHALALARCSCQLLPMKRRRLSHRRYPHRRVSYLQTRAL